MSSIPECKCCGNYIHSGPVLCSDCEPDLSIKQATTTPNQGPGRPVEDGYLTISRVRFLSKAEEARIKAAKAILTPRKKVEIWLAWLDENEKG